VLRVIQASDELTHLVWLVRDTGAAEDDVIVFPAEARLHKMPGPRCFALKFDGQADRNMHFWMQEPHAVDDERLVEALNVALGNTAAAAPPFSAAVPTPAHASASLQSPVAPTLAATSFVPPSSAPPAPSKAGEQVAATPTGTVAATPSAPTLGDLRRILSSMGVPQPGVSPGITAQQTAAALAQAMMGISRSGGGDTAMEDVGPLLSDVLTPDVLLSALTSPEVQQRLVPFLPEEQRDAEALRELVRSPQFGSQLRTFSRALQSGSIDLAQFGLAQGGATAFNVADFLAAIQNAAQSEEAQEPKPGDDTDMRDPQ